MDIAALAISVITLVAASLLAKMVLKAIQNRGSKPTEYIVTLRFEEGV